jgi:hypothetical protein
MGLLVDMALAALPLPGALSRNGSILNAERCWGAGGGEGAGECGRFTPMLLRDMGTRPVVAAACALAFLRAAYRG